MNGWLVAMTALHTLSTISVGAVTESVPAWQAPGFVMEEIVVTSRIDAAVLPAWQQAGFVMEEVVATASAEEVAEAWREQMHRRAWLHVARLHRAESSE